MNQLKFEKITRFTLPVAANGHDRARGVLHVGVLLYRPSMNLPGCLCTGPVVLSLQKGYSDTRWVYLDHSFYVQTSRSVAIEKQTLVVRHAQFFGSNTFVIPAPPEGGNDAGA